MHADLNAAMNILARGGGKVPTRVRVLSIIPTASKVIAVNEKKTATPQAGRGNRVAHALKAWRAAPAGFRNFSVYGKAL
jgi:transposase